MTLPDPATQTGEDHIAAKINNVNSTYSANKTNLIATPSKVPAPIDSNDEIAIEVTAIFQLRRLIPATAA